MSYKKINMEKNYDLLMKLMPYKATKNHEIEMIIVSLINQLNKLLTEITSSKSNVERVIIATCLHFNIEKKALFGKTRKREIIKIKKFITYFVYIKIPGLSLNEIAKSLDNRDHSTILYRINEVKKILSFENPEKNEYLKYETFLNEIL